MFRGSGWWSLINADQQSGKLIIDRNMLHRIFRYARPYWLYVSIVLITIVLTSLIELIPPLLYRDLIDNVIPNGDFARLSWLALGMIGIPLLSGLIGTVERYFSARAGEGIIYDLRLEMYTHLQSMSLRFFTSTKSGEIISRFNNDVVGAQNAIVGTIPNILTNVITLVSTLVIMVSIEWRLALLSITVFPLFLLPARRVARVLRDIWRKAMDYNAEMSTIISETLSINGALLTKTFGSLTLEVDKFNQVDRNVRDIGVRRALVGRWFFLGLSLSGAIGTALIYWVGGYMALTGSLTVGTIVAFAAYLTRLYGPISSLTNVQVEFATSIVSFERVFEYLDLPVEIKDREGATSLENVHGKVEFKNVSFSYLSPQTELTKEGNGKDRSSEPEEPDLIPVIAASRRWALRDLSFTIEPGELVALVGHSGAGKTTVTYLLPRLYDPAEGKILIDGHDLRDVTLESLAGQIGVVTQETYLFHDTILANLKYACPTASQDQVDSACQAAYIYEFISRLPDGYDTVVGERGYRLSGGEKQRIAIARVILKDPRILILDEATSHLDSQNEALVQAALAPLFANRTSLVIAHRLSTILAANKILVLEDGILAEEGSHADLLAKGGLYANLYETQFRNETRSTESNPTK
jgi:ATP-binding cassette subfamily B protein